MLAAWNNHSIGSWNYDTHSIVPVPVIYDSTLVGFRLIWSVKGLDETIPLSVEKMNSYERKPVKIQYEICYGHYFQLFLSYSTSIHYQYFGLQQLIYCLSTMKNAFHGQQISLARNLIFRSFVILHYVQFFFMFSCHFVYVYLYIHRGNQTSIACIVNEQWWRIHFVYDLTQINTHSNVTAICICCDENLPIYRTEVSIMICPVSSF